jgi:hypothetical protein
MEHTAAISCMLTCTVTVSSRVGAMVGGINVSNVHEKSMYVYDMETPTLMGMYVYDTEMPPLGEYAYGIKCDESSSGT